ncbi:MAG: alpha/beta hydrolase [Deltaproteobacteria bacterium]|nr:alpha/beta hydrolase [Deltaproteobacteria bacterium]
MPTLALPEVTLAYDDRGTGDPALVLIHGLACDRSYLAPQAERFVGRHRVVSVDLRGHGESSAAASYRIRDFGDDVLRLLDALELPRVVVAGHSMGGLVALEVAARDPERVVGAALLDSPILLGAETGPIFKELLAALAGPNYVEVFRAFNAQCFFPYEDAARRERLLNEMCSVPREVVLPALEAIVTYDSAAACARISAPLLYLRGLNAVSEALWHEHVPHGLWGQPTGAGHFHQLEVPDQVNAMLDRFLALALRS